MSAQIVRVRQVMKTEFDTVDSMATVYDALKSMRHIETKCLIVNKRHNDDEHGMLLLSDVARKVIGLNRSPERVNVYEVMAKPVITVDPEMNIRYCARLFDRFELSRAPVAENGKVVGIVSFTDMVLRGLLPE
jgi:predicted transcriptional regulator